MERVARGEDPLCTYRTPHDVIDLPMERDKFGSAVEFRQLWTRESSIRYSPIRSEVLAAVRRPGAGVELVRFCPACGAAGARVRAGVLGGRRPARRVLVRGLRR